MKRGVRIALACVGLAAIGLVVASHRHLPRSELSRSLHLLDGIEPSNTQTMAAVPYSPRHASMRGATWNTEYFEIDRGVEEVSRLLALELGSNVSSSVPLPDDPPGSLFIVDQGAPERFMYIKVQGKSPDRTSVTFAEPRTLDAVDRFFAWVRRMTGGP